MRPRLIAAAALALVAAAVARPLARRRAAASRSATPRPARESWRCACGQGFLVAGRDRHRICWLEGAAEAEPLLTDCCPSCDRPLPAEHEAGVAVG
jgi:hypothetical protein